MIHITRLPKPQRLIEKSEQWTSDFIASGKKRPDNKKYGHPQIKDTLFGMSFYKCYYCERKLKTHPKEIDHFIEVSEKEGKQLAFEWSNLYLACDNCNGKIPNRMIPVSSVLDPCKHSDDEISTHLLFEDEVITAKNGSPLGLKTIQKYKLDSDQLDLVRAKQLKEFMKLLLQIKDKMIAETRINMTESEKDKVLSFQHPDKSFSLMFKQLIAKLTIG